MVGEDDALTPPSAARALAALLPAARLEIVPAAGHLSNIEDPAAFNELLGRLLQDASAPPRAGTR